MSDKTILELKPKEAEAFFLDQNNYHTFLLPPSYTFGKALAYARKTIGNKTFQECVNQAKEINNFPHKNHIIMLNKDGKYAARPLVLSNPYLYAFLVREICKAPNWKELKKFFKETKLPSISRCAIPVVPDPDEDFHGASSVLHWWTNVEQKSIELSLQYKYMLVTDITNCYGSIRQSVLADAFRLNGTMQHRSDTPLWIENILELLFHLQNGSNMGIPQGAIIYDLLGEIVLAYVDVMLAESLSAKGITDYHIIRYRDDYRIYANSMDEVNIIGVLLQNVLNSLGLTLNSGKTNTTDSIIEDSIKPDKLFYLFNTPVYNKKGCDFDSVQKHLLYIHQFAKKYPNSGQLITQLSYLERHIEGKDVEPLNDTPTKTLWFHHKQVAPLVAILVDIALKNPKCAVRCISIIGILVAFLKSDKERYELLNKVCGKVCQHINTGLEQIWLQQLTIHDNKIHNTCPYSETLCHLAQFNSPAFIIWDNFWIRKDLDKDFPYTSLYDASQEPQNGKLAIRNENTYDR